MSNHLPNVEGMSLDNPHVDKAINAGTTAPNCQPRHTLAALDNESSSSDLDDSSASTTNGGSSTGSSNSRKARRAEKKARKKEKKAQAARRKQQQENDPKKMGYIQMAKMGYQELVNAIIRPPRAEYKVGDIECHELLLVWRISLFCCRSLLYDILTDSFQYCKWDF